MLVGVVMLAVGTGGRAECRFDALAEHLDSHPAATAQDVYKFIHQGIFGPGHMIPDRDAAGRYLSREIEALDLSQVIEAPCEPLWSEPPMMRVHLRPYVRAGFDVGELVDALIATAGHIDGDSGEMRRALDAASDWLRDAGRPDTADELSRLRADMQPSGFPAVHHSEEYRAAYHPAYRVVLARYAHERGWCGAPNRP